MQTSTTKDDLQVGVTMAPHGCRTRTVTTLQPHHDLMVGLIMASRSVCQWRCLCSRATRGAFITLQTMTPEIQRSIQYVPEDASCGPCGRSLI